MAEKTIKPTRDRHAGIKLLPKYVYADDAARNREMQRDAAAAFLETKTGGEQPEYSISTVDLMKTMPPGPSAEVYSYGGKNYSSFEAAKAANSRMESAIRRIRRTHDEAMKRRAARRGYRALRGRWT